MLSGHGLVSSIIGPSEPPLSAYRILSPSIVRNCGSIDVVCEVVMTVPFEVGSGGHVRSVSAAKTALAAAPYTRWADRSSANVLASYSQIGLYTFANGSTT